MNTDHLKGKLFQLARLTSLVSVISLALVLALVVSAFGWTPALAGCSDGTNGDNTLDCTSDSSNDWKGKNGDDVMTEDAGVNIEGNAQGDGTVKLGSASGGDDVLEINGNVEENVNGDGLAAGLAATGGDDVVTIGVTGNVEGNVNGDGIVAGGAGIGGDDEVTIDGHVEGNVTGDGIAAAGVSVGGDDILVVSETGTVEGNVSGDGVAAAGGTSGGDDTITIDGTVEGNVYGDGMLSAGSRGGDDVIIVNGTVEGDVLADGLAAFEDEGGDDTVIVGEDASIEGTIDGGDGTDTLVLKNVYQDKLDALDPNDGTITKNGQTYTWLNFEFLVGKLREIAEEAVNSGRGILYASGNLLGVESDDGGFNVFGEPGRIAKVSYADLDGSQQGDALTFQAPNSQGWYVVVVNLGSDPNNAAHNLFQVSIYNLSGGLEGQFTVSH